MWRIAPAAVSNAFTNHQMPRQKNPAFAGWCDVTLDPKFPSEYPITGRFFLPPDTMQTPAMFV
jgi:hypothetical protein